MTSSERESEIGFVNQRKNGFCMFRRQSQISLRLKENAKHTQEKKTLTMTHQVLSALFKNSISFFLFPVRPLLTKFAHLENGQRERLVTRAR